MLPVPGFRQTTNYCGPTALRMVLAYHGVRVSERRIAQLAGSTRALGTSAEGLVTAAHALGFTASIKDHATFADMGRLLRKKTPPIVDWFEGDDGHYSVVVNLTATHITLRDPIDGKHRRMSRDAFLRVWFDFPGTFIRTKDDLLLRQLIVVRPRT